MALFNKDDDGEHILCILWSAKMNGSTTQHIES